MRIHSDNRAWIVPLILLCVGCGGGGGSSSGNSGTNPAPSNQAPIANAGGAQTVSGLSDVILDGTGSNDPDGSIDSWQWQQTAGPEVNLTGADNPQTRFTAPDLPQGAELVFSLTVTDNEGASDMASAMVAVSGTDPSLRYSVAGEVTTSTSQALDGDTNDPANPLAANDSIGTAQALVSPITLGGYVNQPGTGADGRSTVVGDIDDYYRLDLIAGQAVTMLVADYQLADADLYVLDLQGNIVDFSIATGELETITVNANGTYFVNVFAFEGATSYTLAIGSRGQQLGVERYANVIPWEAVVEYREDDDVVAEQHRGLRQRMGLHRQGGGPGRARLLAIRQSVQESIQLARGLGNARQRRSAFADDGLRVQWETLMTVKTLRRDPQVRYAEPNYRVSTFASTNDEALSVQWHYPLISLPAAWDTSTGVSDVVVAIIDTGILSAHPDLQGQLVPGYDFVRDPQVSGDGDGIDPNPEDPGNVGEPGASSFHGSHVGGTVAAAGNNGIGVAGVAYGARIMPLRALGGSGSGSSYDVSQAVRYAAGLTNDSGTVPPQRADIINLSLGGESFNQLSQALYREIYEAGVIVVAAAGNEGSTRASYPAAYDKVISVSAVDAQAVLASYSNRGSRIDIAAPGGNNSTDFNGDGFPDGVLSTGRSASGFAYVFLSGTSMAAPHVAGVMALMKSVNPGLTAADIDALLEAGELTDDLGSAGRDDLYGHGLINAQSAVTAALSAVGGTPATEPGLAASTSVLNFGAGLDTLTVSLRNRGEGDLELQAVSVSQPWLSVSPSAVDANGLGSYQVTVDRQDLVPGSYAATLSARSTANSLDIEVLLSVGGTTESDLGVVYILLYDIDNDVVAAETATFAINGSYSFNFSSIPGGRYQVIAGTDLDNDLFICDPGEACGSWLTIEQPLAIDLSRDTEDIVFPIEYLVAIPTLSNYTNAASGTNETLQRSATLTE
ncbi:MAG: serine protease [Alcanivorax sp.]|jgi:serine protease